ncbi:LuxR C-terminal-related transcriptional regulator [Streptomyces sp. NPDC020965]|uniref:helix-turn-helix domain-containing protein n=1 Tax=Streptomyces sp. NPDC020965 TaxID=3365105 RepID=UPI0037A690C3
MIVDDAWIESGDVLRDFPADGYLAREDLTADSLHRAFSDMASGRMPLPLPLGRKLFDRAREGAGPVPTRSIRLTPREEEALLHLVAGLSNRQIARQLGISEHGVKRLVSSVLIKLGVTNRTAAVAAALQSGLVASG